jgi:PilZ domain
MRERRKNFRVEWNSPGKIYDRNGRLAWPCIVSNFSNGGAKIVGVEPSKVPDNFILRISPHGRPYECHVIRRSKEGLGVEFTGNDIGMNEPEQRRRRKAKRKQETSAMVWARFGATICTKQKPKVYGPWRLGANTCEGFLLAFKSVPLGVAPELTVDSVAGLLAGAQLAANDYQIALLAS